MKIIADSHIPYVKEFFGNCGNLTLIPGRCMHAKDVKDADILLVRSITHVNRKLLQGSRVKFVGSVTAGSDHLDTDYLDQVGIGWCVATGFNAPPVADYIICVVAALQQKQIIAKKNIKAAIIGLGNVGKLVHEKFRILGFEVTTCDPIKAERESNFDHTPIDQLEDLDLITLHVPLTRRGEFPTHHFINDAFLKRQKPGCVLINASRGAVIDSQALLKSGGHLFWCLDVWESEPNIHKSILERAMIATPHIAGYSIQSKIRGIDMVYRLACENQIIHPTKQTPIAPPYQELEFAGEIHNWQDIVLGIFNPLLISAMMRNIILPIENYGHYFDEMRNQFNYRYEFAYTNIKLLNLAHSAQHVLTNLGITQVA